MLDIVSLIEKEKEDFLEVTDSDYEYEGKIIPRTTKVINTMINEEYIATWANSLGFKRKGYKRTLSEAADKGSFIHELCHLYLSNQDTNTLLVPIEYQEEVYTGFESFLLWIKRLDNPIVVMTEHTIICPYFGGTADLVLNINNKNYLLDFKTGTHNSFKYYLQLSAYKWALETYYNMTIDGVGIIQLNKVTPSVKEYVLELSDNTNKQYIDYCTNTFFSLLYAYNNRNRVETMYKDVVQEGWK